MRRETGGPTRDSAPTAARRSAPELTSTFPSPPERVCVRHLCFRTNAPQGTPTTTAPTGVTLNSEGAAAASRSGPSTIARRFTRVRSVAPRGNPHEPRRRAGDVGCQARLYRSPPHGLTEQSLDCGMHFPCLHRRFALLENSDDRLLDPVVSAMTASHGSLQSLDVLAVRSAFGPIGVTARCEDAVEQRPQGPRGVGMVSS